MQEMSIRTTAQIYNFSELQRKKHERELREKRPFFITGIIVFISLLTICCFLYFSNSIVRAKEPSSDIQYKVVEVQEGDSLWSIARENLEEKSNDYGFTDICHWFYGGWSVGKSCCFADPGMESGGILEIVSGRDRRGSDYVGRRAPLYFDSCPS